MGEGDLQPTPPDSYESSLWNLSRALGTVKESQDDGQLSIPMEDGGHHPKAGDWMLHQHSNYSQENVAQRIHKQQ